jgi:ABC-type multidrug transport system fused ATPase/permease subunit
VKSQASTIHQLRRVTTLMDSPLKTYVQIGFFLIAESLDPVLTAFALKHLIDSLVSLDAARVWQATLLYLTAMVFCAVISGAGVSVRVDLVEELACKQREGLIKAGVGIPLLEFERLPRGDLVFRLIAYTLCQQNHTSVQWLLSCVHHLLCTRGVPGSRAYIGNISPAGRCSAPHCLYQCTDDWQTAQRPRLSSRS